MRSSSATVAAVPASAFWWQWPWKTIGRLLTAASGSSASEPSSIASTSSSSTSRVCVRDGLRARVVGQQAGCSSRSVSRHDGSQPTIGTPRSASGASRATIASAIPCAWSSRPLEMLERPQQPALSSRTFQPAASSSSIAARPIAGSVKVVNESARKTTSPLRAAPRPRAACVPAQQRLAGEARQRPPAVDARHALEQRRAGSAGSRAARWRRRAG